MDDSEFILKKDTIWMVIARTSSQKNAWLPLPVHFWNLCDVAYIHLH